MVRSNPEVSPWFGDKLTGIPLYPRIADKPLVSMARDGDWLLCQNAPVEHHDHRDTYHVSASGYGMIKLVR